MRFLGECILTFLLWFFFWAATHVSQLELYGADPAASHIWTPFLIYSCVGVVLAGMIYYGTSFQVTPFRILTSLFVWAVPSGKMVLSQIDQATPDVAPTLSGESVDEILRDAASSAELLANTMERRINLHLTFGVLTGGVGLAVWYVTFYRSGIVRSGVSFTDHLFDTLPRLTILLFIEVLAGFFLRQYRIGVEDLKYFLELRRRAEAKRIAYSIFERVNNLDAKLEFATWKLGERIEGTGVSRRNSKCAA